MNSSSPLSLSRSFAVEKYSRAIDRCQDVEELRSLAKLLLKVWRQQADFSERYGAQMLRVKPGEGVRPPWPETPGSTDLAIPS